MTPTVLVDDSGAVRTVTLNRPAKRNAIDIELRIALAEAIEVADSDRAVRAIVITGAGPAFCSGEQIEPARRQLNLAAAFARDHRHHLLGEDLHLLRLAVGSQAAKNANASGSAFREEDVAIGSSPQQARIIQASRILLNLETCRRDGPRACRSRNYIGTIFRRFRCVRLGKIIHSDLARRSRFFVSEISERRLWRWRLEA